MKRTSAFTIVATLAVLTFCSVTRAQNEAFTGIQNGNGLYSSCISSDATDKAMCASYVVGAADSYRLLWSGMTKERPLFCVPAGVTNSQIVDVTVDYLRTHPATRQNLSAAQVLLAMHGAWPCTGQ